MWGVFVSVFLLWLSKCFFVKRESLDWMRFLHALFSGLAVFGALSIRHGMISVFGLGSKLAE